MRRSGAQRGQASVELVAMLPALVALALVSWWVAATSATWLAAGGAAPAGAPAAGVGEDAAARVHGVLPGARVRGPGADGTVRVDLPGPVLPVLGAVTVGAAVPVVAP
ncbi:MAG: hypothetical protein U0Y82_12755 [Thermoleophilia bacterium]